MFKENIVAWRGTLRPHQTYCQDSHQKPSAINSSSVLRKVVQLYTMMYAHRYQSAFFFAKISHLSLSAAVRYYLALICIDIQVRTVKGKASVYEV